jgi:tRNA (mo5U34)-methyltransferase
MNQTEMQNEVDQYPWYHTIDLGNGVVTKGMFDHRASEDHHLLPADLLGMRCLDVGTMDGYWAFAMERRGADEVVAVDIEDPEDLDWPASLRHRIAKTMDETKTARFELARDSLGSSVKRQLRSVYSLDVDLGLFDLVFCGDLLLHLKDPVTALERIRRVCRGSAIICNPIKEHFPYRRRPLAQLDGVGEFQWWVTNQAGLERMILSTAGGPWKGRRGVVRAWV